MIEMLDECTLYLYRELCTRTGLDFDGDILPCALKAVSEQNSVKIGDTIEIAGHTFPLTLDRLYAAEYRAQGKRYPEPRNRKSKMRMSKKWRERA